MDESVIFLLLAAIGIQFLIWHDRRGRDKRKRQEAVQEAEVAYQMSLLALEVDPNNAERRRDALIAGREYARVVRENEGVTLFDEATLMNQINATAGQPVTAQPNRTNQASSQLSFEERLARLQKLAAEGHLTKERIC